MPSTIERVSRDKKLLLIAAYRSPSGNFENFIEKFNEVLENVNKRKEFTTFILGDFNVNLYNPSNHRCRNYLTHVFSNGFLPLISRATHFAGSNPSCIDQHRYSTHAHIRRFDMLRST